MEQQGNIHENASQLKLEIKMKSEMNKFLTISIVNDGIPSENLRRTGLSARVTGTTCVTREERVLLLKQMNLS